MPFEPGMDSYMQSFAPVPLSQRLKLKAPQIRLKKTRQKVAAWYRTALTLEEKKPMQKPPPVIKAETVAKRVDYAHGNSYTGDWVNGKRHGKGQFLCESKGYLFRGEWKNDTIDGQGSMFTRNPDKTWFLTYVGDYKNGLRHGWGTERKSVEEYYEGLWVKGTREGWGRHFAPDGTIYEGQWHEGKRSGYGCTREGSGNHHVGEYLSDMKHGAGKYTYIVTGKCLKGTWKNDIPVLGEIIQLKIYKPSFPHQYPMPEQGLKDPKTVLIDGMQMTCRITPPHPLCPLEWPILSADNKVFAPIDQDTRDQWDSGCRTEDGFTEIDMRQILREIEPDVAAITDPYEAAKTADYLLAMEYMWRSTADRTQPRPLRVQKLLARNSQEFNALANQCQVVGVATEKMTVDFVTETDERVLRILRKYTS